MALTAQQIAASDKEVRGLKYAAMAAMALAKVKA